MEAQAFVFLDGFDAVCFDKDKKIEEKRNVCLFSFKGGRAKCYGFKYPLNFIHLGPS